MNKYYIKLLEILYYNYCKYGYNNFINYKYEVVKMARGSFNGLYTFQDVAKIYNIDSSTIRKQVQNQKFINY